MVRLLAHRYQMVFFLPKRPNCYDWRAQSNYKRGGDQYRCFGFIKWSPEQHLVPGFQRPKTWRRGVGSRESITTHSFGLYDSHSIPLGQLFLFLFFQTFFFKKEKKVSVLLFFSWAVEAEKWSLGLRRGRKKKKKDPATILLLLYKTT